MTIFSICTTILMAVANVQQPSVFDAFRQKSLEECINVEYEFSTTIAGFDTIGEGTVMIQGNSYHMKGNGVEIYCDGASTWLIDETAYEVIIESAASPDAGFLANPIMLLMNLEESGISYKVQNNSILLDMPDGSRYTIKITALTTVPTKKPEAFRPPTEFSKQWVVTDLR